jgi:hypothetical protein
MTILLVPACVPSGIEAASCGARQYAGTGGVEEGQSSVCVLTPERKYPFPYHKRKTIIFILGRKNSNSGTSTKVQDEGRYGSKGNL